MTATNPTNTAKSTKVIAGHSFFLTTGRRYLASRPIATRGRTEYDVSITDITDGFDFNRPPYWEVTGLSYDAANALLAAFNHGKMSFDGRVW